jgi:hypothetical protein
MDYNTERSSGRRADYQTPTRGLGVRFRLHCVVCGRMTDVQKLDEPALCDNCSHADLREMKRQERQTSDVDAVLGENRRV